MFEEKDIDVISLLLGVNDWGSKNNQVDFVLFEENYRDMIDKIREFLPNVLLICITPTACSKAKGPYSLDDYRNVIEEIVKDRIAGGDKNLKLIRGPEISTTDDILDWTHLSIEGAKRVANNLYYKMLNFMSSVDFTMDKENGEPPLDVNFKLCYTESNWYALIKVIDDNREFSYFKAVKIKIFSKGTPKILFLASDDNLGESDDSICAYIEDCINYKVYAKKGDDSQTKDAQGMDLVFI